MPPMRAQASAIYIGVITLVASVGPLIVSYQSLSCIIIYYHVVPVSGASIP